MRTLSFGGGGVAGAKLAFTDVVGPALKWQVGLLAQTPIQWSKREPVAGSACRVTAAPNAKSLRQPSPLPQLKPEPVIVPLPDPVSDTRTVALTSNGRSGTIPLKPTPAIRFWGSVLHWDALVGTDSQLNAHSIVSLASFGEAVNVIGVLAGRSPVSHCVVSNGSPTHSC